MEATPTIAEAAALIATRKLSPVELTRHCLNRIGQLDDQLNAFLLVTDERAMEDARAAEARMMAGQLRGPLDGIPIAHKDIYDTAGIRTTANSRLLESNVPATDATLVAKLAAAGTVMMGKLTTHEFAHGGPSFDLPWPPARNPWNTAHFTAGSSSGTGAAVAAGLILAGTGSDSGGSIRSPAALCGIAGIKPTYGLCSRTGIQPLAYSMDHPGPMAWTSEDCAIMLRAMAGHDPSDAVSLNRPVPDFRTALGRGVKGLRIGVVRNFHEVDFKVSAPVQAAIDSVVGVFREQGADIRETTLPSLQDYQACGAIILTCEAFALHEPWLLTRFSDYGEVMRDRLVFGGLISGVDYVQALRRRRELCALTMQAMEEVDIVLTASAPSEAPRIETVSRWINSEKPVFTMPFNVTGQPAISVCAGFGPGGLPLGVQLAGKPFEDTMVLCAAHAFETATPWRAKRAMA
jgi:aspartyl-tRNA(Asn)/glutamyl-tRNA(Gln) amidotransferase subunit A